MKSLVDGKNDKKSQHLILHIYYSALKWNEDQLKPEVKEDHWSLDMRETSEWNKTESMLMKHVVLSEFWLWFVWVWSLIEAATAQTRWSF